ncbi:MAG: type II toxin-antitoxin system RelE/ParE family toxin [Nitrospiraceae bacterium]|nr:type II toxin-antitoxin system RelE/ParE family toxin [Nitrospiraceae bacterium]
MKIRWTEKAATQLEQIAVFISHDKPEAAAGVIVNIIKHTGQLMNFPNSGRPGRKKGTRELVIAGTPFTVIYKQNSEVIEIISVFHNAMMP